MTQMEIQLLYEYDIWIDRKLLEVIGLVNKEIDMKDLGSSLGGIHSTIVHILSADNIWLARWTGKTTAPLKAVDIPTDEVFKKQWDAYHCEMNNFVRGLGQDTLDQPLPYTDVKGNTFSHPLCQKMQHKVNHSTYHRGQVVTLLRQRGEKVVSTDFIQYIRQKETRG